VTKKLRVDMICTVRWMDQTPNKTALKVGNQRTGALKNQSTGKIRFYLENWNTIRKIRIDSLTTFQDMIVNLTANFSPAFLLFLSRQGTGMHWANYVYKFAPWADLGCWNDNRLDRAMSQLLVNLRFQIDWFNIGKTGKCWIYLR